MRNPFERLTNGITMHKLVTNVLVVLLAAACIAGAFGGIPYSPPAIIVSALLLVAVCVVGNALLAKIYGARTDSQSSIITALILALVLTPTLDPLKLAVTALIGLIAVASKYVIEIGGRHIFNPVAIALVIASVTGIGYASWWIASPPLAVITAIGALIVLSKTRLMATGRLFILIAAAIVTARGLMTGGALDETLALTFSSWPILFFAGFMLTEPTTLPPRRWQKLLVAGVVAVLFALPFSIGPLSSGPALALVAGNLIAFSFRQKGRITLTLVRKKSLTPSITEFTFQPNTMVRFLPGQYLDVFLPHRKADYKASRRSFSLTSVPGEQNISLGVRIDTEPSTFKRALQALEPGDTLAATNVSGDFVLPRDPDEKLLFIAGGIGITPFISHIRAMKAAGETRDIQLLYFVRSKEAVAYADVASSVPSEIFTDNEKLTPEMIRSVPDYKNRTAYISGPPAMVAVAKKAAKAAGIKKLRTDYFSGY